MTPLDVLMQLVNGIDWWNHKTHEYVYYHDYYDFKQGTLTTSEMVLFDDGYICSDNDADDDAPQYETCVRIVTEDGWMRVDDPRTQDYKNELRRK